jgi:nucleotide-binding universal stress UspA family protein
MAEANTTGFEFGNDGPSVVLVGIDGSETSLRAGAFAAGLARRERSRLVCVFVNTTPAYVVAAGMALAPPALGDELIDELRGLVAEGTVYHGLTAEFVVGRGDPFTEISRIAGKLRADLVVVGASTHAGHRLVGSLAVRLVRAGRWPVTVVP